MGWTFYNSYEFKNGKIDRKAECDKMYTWEDTERKGRVLKSTMRGSVYYAAYEYTNKIKNTKEVIGVVVLTSSDVRNGWNFGYKDMSEFMGPGYYDCPLSILNLLTPTDNECALEWRKKCYEKHNKPKSWLKNLNIGDKIIFTRYDGRKVVLTKHAPAYQFKTWFWYCPETGGYVKKNAVTESNAVLYTA